jgi:hypothetical protein
MHKQYDPTMSDSDSTKSKHKVFISYSVHDELAARSVWSGLKDEGYDIWLDALTLQPGDSWAQKARDALSASDVLIVLLSKASVGSNWLEMELKASLDKEIRKRAITVVPTRIDDCEVPRFFLSERVVDLSGDFERGLSDLNNRIRAILLIDFTTFDPRRFEALVGDLLKESSFFDIEANWRFADREFDFKAKHDSKDPFGQRTTELCVVEVKLYPKERASVALLDQFLAKLQDVPQADSGILFTSGLLTSAASDWLFRNKGRGGKKLWVVDGQELKEMLSTHPKLIERYFTTEAENE